jgi:MoaA/NifB/PqqE/SkfB family radical SAM enzyme
MSTIAPGNIVFLYGLRKDLIRYRIWARLFFLALKEYRSVGVCLKILSRISKFRSSVAGKTKFNRIIKANGQYYWHFYYPGFPSGIFDRHVKGMINRYRPVGSFNNRLTSLFIGLTNSCPLRCQHCYHWRDLNKPGSLSFEAFKEILLKVQKVGVSQINFLGGEPMARYDDLVKLIEIISNRSGVWISTSGYKLDFERASALKKAGLTGVVISVDHYSRDKHNEFRGHKEAFDWAMKATRESRAASLLSCWSLCARNDFISPENLLAYARLARLNHVNFIQFFEAMPSGRYSGQDVGLNVNAIRILEEFYIKINRDREYRDFPIVIYPGYHHRRVGCLGGGNRYIYVDPFGNVHPCPFCHTGKELKFLDHSFEDVLGAVREEPCQYPHEVFTSDEKAKWEGLGD